MTTKEIKTATNMLKKVGRIVTGTILDKRGSRPTTAIETDGDGIAQYFSTPKIFSSLGAVREYVETRD